MKRFFLACLLLLAAVPACAQTVLSFVSPAGEYVGEGATKSFTPSNAYMEFLGTRSAVIVSVMAHDGSSWDLDLFAPYGEVLTTREYFNVERSVFATGRAPGMQFGGGGHGCNKVSGSFAIRQIQFDSANNLSRLEATATQYCDNNPYPLAIEIRYRSSPYMFGLDGATGNVLAPATKKSYYNDRSRMRLSATQANKISYDVSGLGDDWHVQIEAPAGQARFSKGTFYTRSAPPLTEGYLAVTGNGHGCGQSNSGVVNVLEVVYSPAGDRFDKFYADFTHYCNKNDRTGPPLKGRIRYVRF